MCVCGQFSLNRTILSLSAQTGTLYHPAFGGLVRYDIQEVSDDPDTQVAQVIGLMRGYTIADTSSPEIQRDAQSCDSGQAIEDVYRFVRPRIAFTEDAENAAPLTGWLDRFQPGKPVVEVLVRPRDMSVMSSRGDRSGRGDCDDYSMYAAALLRAKGIPVKFVTIAADAEQPDVFSHVYLACYVHGQRIPLDVSHGPYVGWESPVRYRIQEWDIDPSPLSRLAWLAFLGAGAYLAYRRLA